jgi:hypothetical protein
MVLLTITIMFITVFSRIRSVRSGDVNIEYYESFDGTKGPDYVLVSTRHLANLFELPILFYVGCMFSILLGFESFIFTCSAWLFCIFRYFQAFGHFLSKKVPYRLVPYMLSNLSLCVMWISLALAKI